MLTFRQLMSQLTTVRGCLSLNLVFFLNLRMFDNSVSVFMALIATSRRSW